MGATDVTKEKKDTAAMVQQTLVALGRRDPPKQPITFEVTLDPGCSYCGGTGVVTMYFDTGRREWSYETTCRCIMKQVAEVVQGTT